MNNSRNLTMNSEVFTDYIPVPVETIKKIISHCDAFFVLLFENNCARLGKLYRSQDGLLYFDRGFGDLVPITTQKISIPEVKLLYLKYESELTPDELELMQIR